MVPPREEGRQSHDDVQPNAVIANRGVADLVCAIAFGQEGDRPIKIVHVGTHPCQCIIKGS